MNYKNFTCYLVTRKRRTMKSCPGLDQDIWSPWPFLNNLSSELSIGAQSWPFYSGQPFHLEGEVQETKCWPHNREAGFKSSLRNRKLWVV